jgi:prepilin-type N-terminal cleavage/methylation domain-containing protein
MLQYNIMVFSFHKRRNSGCEGFSLIEVLITIALIGIIVALLIPNVQQAQQEATRQTARQQAKVLEKALANWYTSQSSANNATIQAADAFWTNNSDANGYITQNGVGPSGSLSSGFLAPYLDQNGSGFSVAASGAITTPQMQQISLNSGSYSGTFINNGMTPATGCTTAHLRLYWQPDVTAPNGTTTISRITYSPKVIFFLPNFTSSSSSQ